MAAEDQRYGRDKSTIVNKAYIESGAYRRKFDSVVDDQKIARVLYEKAKEMLYHRSGTRVEDMYWIDGDTGDVIAKIIDQPSDITQHVIYTDAVRKAIERYDNIITLHNHPASMPPSPDDFNSYFQKKYNISLVLCHDGTIFQYESFQMLNEGIYDLYIKKYLLRGYTERDAQLKALISMKRNFRFDYWEVI